MGTFKDNILKENKKQDISYLIENSLNKYSVFNSNAFYSLSEDAQKSNTFGAYRNSVVTQKVSEMDVDAESRNKSQFFKNDPLSEDNNELTPSGDTDDQSSEMWGAFENYYENGIKTSTSNESISFSDYSYRFKKKDYGTVYKTLTSSIGGKGSEGLGAQKNSVRKDEFIKLPSSSSGYLQNSCKSPDSAKKPNALLENSDYAVIGSKILRDKINFEIADSFTENYNVQAFSSAVSRYYKFLTGELLTRYKPYRNSNESSQHRSLDINLSVSGIRSNLEKDDESAIDALLLSGIISNKIPHSTKLDRVPIKPNSYSNTDDITVTSALQKLKTREAMHKTRVLSSALLKDLRKLNVDLSKYTYTKYMKTQQTVLRNQPNNYKYPMTNNIPKHDDWVLLSETATGKQLPGSISDKLSDYINTYTINGDNSLDNYNNNNKIRDDAINNHILNTISEENYGIDNKMRLTYIAGNNSEYEVKLPRVLSTLQDIIDEGSTKKFITNYKKKKTNEFAENYSWDNIDPDDTVEDAEEGDLESHSNPT